MPTDFETTFLTQESTPSQMIIKEINRSKAHSKLKAPRKTASLVLENAENIC